MVFNPPQPKKQTQKPAQAQRAARAPAHQGGNKVFSEAKQAELQNRPRKNNCKTKEQSAQNWAGANPKLCRAPSAEGMSILGNAR